MEKAPKSKKFIHNKYRRVKSQDYEDVRGLLTYLVRGPAVCRLFVSACFGYNVRGKLLCVCFSRLQRARVVCEFVGMAVVYCRRTIASFQSVWLGIWKGTSWFRPGRYIFHVCKRPMLLRQPRTKQRPLEFLGRTGEEGRDSCSPIPACEADLVTAVLAG